MTVHGAKGLEAPIVFLADTMTQPAGPRAPQLLKLADGPMIWAGRRADDVAAVASARQTARDEATHEYRRLLYVAMTRAADRLIVCGAESRQKRPEGCWYDLVREPLTPFLVEEDGEEGKVLRYRKQASSLLKPPAPKGQKERPLQSMQLPPWLRQNAPPERPRTAPLAPSAAFEAEFGDVAPRAGSAADRQRALNRGRIVHRLMQALPDIPPARRKDAAEYYLAGAADKFSVAEKDEILRQVFAILDDRDFADIFAPGSRAEMPIVGRLPRDGADPYPVAGQVDRLAVTKDAVLIADYKSDRVVPRGPEEAAPYVAQLALYRAVLKRLYPNEPVRAALIFTEGPVFMEIPAAAMDAALAQALTAGSVTLR
jgi:ATP-dependent helicase/nuclease subunit A